LMEQLRFTDDGQPLSTTMFDYLVPTAADVPALVTEMFETPSPITATGARGAGEIGIIGSGAAVAGAVTAAFEGRVNADRLPLTPPRVRALARRASTRRERLAG
jgi:CO/xanthine dehydrogenase Mo-binding subunit